MYHKKYGQLYCSNIVMGVYGSNHFRIYVNVKSLHSTSENNLILYVNYVYFFLR